MILPPKAEFLSQLETLLSRQISIFGLKLLEPLETIVRTRIVPVALNIAGQETSFGVACNEEPYDLFPLENSLSKGRIQRIRMPTTKATLLDVVKVVRDELVRFQTEKIRKVSG